MEEIINVLGSLISTITEFFSMIAPGYFVLIFSMFAGMMPYVIFQLVKKGVATHSL